MIDHICSTYGIRAVAIVLGGLVLGATQGSFTSHGNNYSWELTHDELTITPKEN